MTDDMAGKAVLMGTFLIICVIISYIDIQKQTIYNEAVAALFVPAIVSFFVFPEITPLSRMLGAVSVSGLMLFISMLKPGAFGGGDIKMMIPIGLFLGLEKTLIAWILAVFIEALLIVWKLIRKAFIYSESSGKLPFGPALCLGSVIAMFYSI